MIAVLFEASPCFRWDEITGQEHHNGLEFSGTPLALCAFIHVKDRCRRIDRILIPYAYQSHLKACYPTFLASSDHRAIVLHLKNNSSLSTNKRIPCPTAFLQDLDTVAAIEAELVLYGMTTKLGGLWLWTQSACVPSTMICGLWDP